MAEQKKNNYLWPGVVLAIVGLYLLLPRLGMKSADNLWPIFIFIPGFNFLQQYWRKKNRRENAGLLTTGVLAVGISLFFLYLNFTDINDIDTLWPVFPIIIGFALLIAYLGGGKEEKKMLIPGVVMGGVGVFFLLAAKSESLIWPIVLTAFGALLIAISFKGKSDEREEKPKDEEKPEREEERLDEKKHKSHSNIDKDNNTEVLEEESEETKEEAKTKGVI